MYYYNIRKIFLVDCYNNNLEQSIKIDRFLSLLDKSGVCKLIESKIKTKDETKGGRPQVDPYNLLAVILFNFAFNKATVRDIEDKIKNDLRCIYIMQGEYPSHMTISNFINEYIIPNQCDIFSLITKEIFNECKLKMDDMYIDGSKFEANANKYKFVWKPTTYHNNLSNKIRLLLSNYNLLRGIKKDGIISTQDIALKISEFNKLIENLDLTLKENKNYKRDYFLLVEYLTKSLEYEDKERICGPDRNSFYKTDKDATAMCLKEDYYSGLGSNMHAAYNTQISVVDGLITAYLITQSRNDLKDFIPILTRHYSFYKCHPMRLCADSGYGSLENYIYLKENNIKNFVKYYTWQGNVSGKNPSQYYINDDETITCLNGVIGYKINKSEVNHHSRKASSTFYKIEGCNNCQYKLYCKRYMKNKDDDFKIFEVSIELQKFIQEAEKNLLSLEGIEMRVNRSFQAEGAFGVIKQDFQYDRFRRRSIEKVSAEFMLICLGYNIRKLFRYFEGNLKASHWKAPLNIEPEKFKNPSAKRLSNKTKKNKSVNEEAKSNYKYAK